MSSLPGEESPELRIHCQDCDEVDFTARMSSIGVSASGVSLKTDDKLEEMLEDEFDCEACGGTVVIDLAHGETRGKFQWEGYTTPEEQRMARQLLEVDKGDEVRMKSRTKEGLLTVFYIDDRPGVRELRARPDPTESSQPDLRFFVVRQKYVFILADYETGLENLVMSWPKDERVGDHLQIVREDDGG